MNDRPRTYVLLKSGAGLYALEPYDALISSALTEWVEFTGANIEGDTCAARVRQSEIAAITELTDEAYARALRQAMARRAAEEQDETMRAEITRMASRLTEMEGGDE